MKKIIFLTINDNRNISSSLLHWSPSRKPNPTMGGWQQRRRSSRRDYNSRPLRLPPALLILLLQHLSSSLLLVKMAFTFAAFAYILALIIDAFLIFFAIFHVGHVSVPINEQSKCFLWMIMKFFNWITTNHKNSIQMQLPTSCDDSILKYKLFLKIWKSINCVPSESKSKWGQIGPELWKATCAVSIQIKLQIVIKKIQMLTNYIIILSLTFIFYLDNCLWRAEDRLQESNWSVWQS